MKKFIYVFITICFVSVFAFAQSQPFEVFDKAVKTEKAGFSGNKENLSEVFNQERIRLGENFETELWKYLGNDVEKHYWIGFFLKSKSYLHGNQPLPELALKVWQNAIELIKDESGEQFLGRRFKLLVWSAVLSEKLNKKDLATAYKKESDALLSPAFDLQTYFPALSKYERCLYLYIGASASPCEQDSDASQNPQETIINGGIINGKAVELAKPKYPKEARKKKISGQFHVRVVIDFDGNILSAAAVRGPTELFEVSEEAALKSKFTPTTLSGKPVKVLGIIIYNFVR